MRLYNTSFEKLIEHVKGKVLICYGAGKMLDEMAEEMPEIIRYCETLSIVDGDPSKVGQRRRVFEEDFTIESIETAVLRYENYVVLITSAMIEEILKRLSDTTKSNTKVFSFWLMKKEWYDQNLINIVRGKKIIGKKTELQIPKMIHYFWYGKKPIPYAYQKNIETWIEKCPDYKLVRWDETNCDLDECNYAKEAYSVGRFGFVPDYFRLKRIYEYGGIYLDLDVKLLKPLDELLYLEAYVAFEDNERVNFGTGFGACKGFELLKDMYTQYEGLSFFNADGTLNTTASPVYQTNILAEMGLKPNGEMQIVGGMTILPMNYLTVQSKNTGRLYVTPESFSIHQYAASWFSDTDKRKKNFAEKILSEVEYI